MRAVVTALALGLCLASEAAADDEVGEAVSAAAEALKDGDFARASELAGDLAREVGRARPPEVEAASPSSVSRQDRAEVWRIFGLALFFEGELGRAEEALLEYLKLDDEAHLDPALVPPEAIVFFEDVRARHRAEIRAYHPEPEERRWLLLNLAPPGGQFQNGHRRKGWTVTASGVALITVNVGTYAGLARLCDAERGCQPYRRAQTLKALNIGSAVGLGAVYLYGVIDGFAGYRRASRDLSISVVPGRAPGIAVNGRF